MTTALTPNFLFDFESNMDRLTENEFIRLSASENLWYRDVTKVSTTKKKREIKAWILSTLQIYQQGDGTNGPGPGTASGAVNGVNGAHDVATQRFDDMAAIYTEYDVLPAVAGLKLSRIQIEDNDGNGLQLAEEWSSQAGALMAYWPQQKISQRILNGALATSLAYDGVQYFADNIVNSGNGHPLNQFKTSAGKYFNWFHGAASGIYPGALPIDESVSVDVALANLQKAIAYIASIKMPNGVTPRYLKPRRLMVPPRLVARAQQLTNARYIAQAAGASGGGSGDIEAIISNWGFMQPIEVQEFAGVAPSNVLGGQADLTWYLCCEQMTSTQLGALIYLEREPFAIRYYTGQGGGTGVDAVLDRGQNLEWHLYGRNIDGFGHPYALHRFDAA